MSDEPRPIEVVPATADRWADVALLLDGGGEVGCWCQPWRGDVAKGESRPDALRRQMAESAPPPGFVAYVDGEPAGWVGVSARSIAPRLRNSRTIPAIDDRDVWAIGCFRIRPGFRRRGVASALLDGIVAAAREAGAPGVEAYPVDPAGKRVDVSFGFVGIASMFDRAGFRRVVETGGHSAGLPRILVRLDLEPGHDAA
jgi:GNAT superfamily N-acetyltransferase